MTWLKKYRAVVAVLAVYLVGGLLLLGWYKNQLNPDGVAYISIATKYAHGQFGDAVNGYWGPMLSWLLAPFAVLHLNMQTAAKLIGLGAGAVVILLSWLLANRWRVHAVLAQLLAWVLVPFCWYWALPSPITPDLLMVAVLLAYLYVLTESALSLRTQAVLLGIIGAAGYFTKSYFLPFFAAHMLLWAVVEGQRNKQIPKKYLVGLAVAALLIAPWVVALSAKYHKFTFSTTGPYNFSLIGPETLGHPVNSAGLLAPPNATAISAWEDPAYLAVKQWSPLSSAGHLVYYLQVVIENVRVIGALFLGFSVFSLAILLWAVASVLRRGGSKQRRELALLVSAVVMYVGGYALILREERYLWPAFALMLLVAAVLGSVHKYYQKRAADALMVGLFVASLVWAPIATLLQQKDVGLSVRQGAAVLQPLFTGKERIASDTFDSIAYCYYLKVTCHGAFSAEASDQTNRQQLADHKITDVLLLKAQADWQKPDYLADYQEVATNNPAVKLLRLKAQY